ncbi:cytochrome P450 [Novosphingobium aquae]|uniref:Cytochrome P450 n=1 Tax=Novosphingobium aquae TaxID=3133435 RepID=A0ABU8S6T4_9SPHN
MATQPDSAPATCPLGHGRDDRKSAAMADAMLTPQPGARVIERFYPARDMLRSAKVRQAGAHAAGTDISAPADVSFFFLDGEEHRKRRASVAGLFAPKTIVNRHQVVMNRTMDLLEAKLKRLGSAPLDELSFQMAVDVTADIIGLTNSDSNENLAQRIKAVLDSSASRRPGLIGNLVFGARMAWRVGQFYRRDLKPAIDARRKVPQDDVISAMIKDGAGRKLMIMEALSYGGAGMMTTREFIVMAAWHLFGNEALRTRYLNGDEADQLAILQEILRLEPVASLVHRRIAEPVAPYEAGGDVYTAGDVVAVSIRAVNTDEAITGPCPYELDPDRAKRMKVLGPYLSFGDGAHRCPGAQVALHETRIFLDRLFRLPGIRLVSEPTVLWNAFIQGYELRGAVVACDPA